MRRLGIWLQNRPVWLERAYRLTHALFRRLDPILARLGYARADRLLRSSEAWSKKILFDCRMCGQCILHSTGMTCPMTCPKNLRNGPCGGVRQNGHCEVIPTMRCIWVDAFERSQLLPTHGVEILQLQPPVNQRLEGSSAWINMLIGRDQQPPPAWPGQTLTPLADQQEKWS